MYVKRNISWRIIAMFAWKNILFFLAYGFAVTYAYHWLDHEGINISIPFLPLSTIGIAVAFYIGFKNNQSYDRFWEARKIWGGIVNYSRTWGNLVMSFVTLRKTDGTVTEEEINYMHKKLIYRHIAWINALRLQLRRPSSFSMNLNRRDIRSLYKGEPGGEDWMEGVGTFIITDGECKYIKERKNPATHLIRLQGEELKRLMEVGMIEDFRHMKMMETLEECYNLQGKCERINNTPLPRQYAYFSLVFTWLFILLLPFGLVGEFASMGHSFVWLTLPFFVLISWIFITMEKVGDTSEDPFENFINDVPMTALCRTIEIDLREMLGETELPEKIKPEKHILM